MSNASSAILLPVSASDGGESCVCYSPDDWFLVIRSGILPSDVVYYGRKELNMMDDMILSVNTLPYPLNKRIRSNRVRVREENGVFMLTPMVGAEPAVTQGMSTEEALKIFHKHAGTIKRI